MAVSISSVEVWAGNIQDQSGSLASVLERIADAGASLDCVIARRHPDRPGAGDVFVSGAKGRKAQDAAGDAGLMRAQNVATLRIEGNDKAGLGSKITRAIADAGVNIRGVSAMALGGKFVAYIGFDNAQDADRASKAIKAAGVNGAGKGRARAAAARRPSARRRARSK
jgi:hypothetical protein